MNVGLAHILSLLAVAAYGYASFGYARVLAPAAGAPRELTPRGWLRSVLVVGLLCHLLFVLLTDLSAVPLQRFPHTISLVSLGLVGTFLLLEQRLNIAVLGAFIAPAALLFLLISAVTFHLGAKDEIAAHGGLLISLHLVCTVFSYVLLFVAAGASAALLLSESALKKKRPLQTGAPLPSLLFLDRFHRGLVLLGALFLALGLCTGTVASKFFTIESEKMYARLLWILPEVGVYAMLLIALYGRGIRGRRLAWMTLGGVALVFFSLLGAVRDSGGFHGF